MLSKLDVGAGMYLATWQAFVLTVSAVLVLHSVVAHPV
jgi:hypothetical protein